MALSAVAHEFVLFAAIGFLIGGLDDLVIDAIWLGRIYWRRTTIYRRYPRGDLLQLAPPDRPGWIAVFVAAWQEAAVIGQMAQTALDRFDHPDYRLYIGCYPNDPETIRAVAAVAAKDARLCQVILPHPGPTTKADCLNGLWRKMLEDERDHGQNAKAIVLHDAEDIVHSGELRIFDRLIERYDLVQLPVLPLIDPGSRWISGHYNDEFAEAHGKAMVVREALGAAIPAAGVGCAFSRRALARVAAKKGGAPFDADSLTEDYELGLGIATDGGKGIFVSLPSFPGGKPVSIRAHFPATFRDAVRQKSRWMAGIALSGWDRMGWRGGFAERWMRLRDRRAPLGAVILLAAYIGFLGTLAAAGAGHLAGMTPAPFTPLMTALLWINLALLLWRLCLRAGFVTRAYGWREGLRAPPRMVIANVVEIFAAARAVKIYRTRRRNGTVVWDKTNHVFPDLVPEE
ncbi:glycosyl transferase family protein [Sphingobium boeckii]|uniref:Adsorption protein B n=1 Tax=Sphingobium boeckii TaxID=1082345 RepID=A0A7W9AL95_9SPHN|nr:glycosyl transferase family protein [Sphingobium boeckii]MBB5687613.1 adsorption protein B [Sphingobium boeckii]